MIDTPGGSCFAFCAAWFEQTIQFEFDFMHHNAQYTIILNSQHISRAVNAVQSRLLARVESLGNLKLYHPAFPRIPHKIAQKRAKLRQFINCAYIHKV